MNKQQTNPNPTNNLPQEIKQAYKTSRKNSPAIETLKLAAAQKLHSARDCTNIKFDTPAIFGKKTIYIKVQGKHPDGTVFAAECATKVKLSRLRERVAVIKTCLPKDSYIVLVFPEDCYERSRRAVKLADEVWITGKNGKVNQMIFHAYLGKM